MTIVRTKEELISAISRKDKNISIRGDLAETVDKALAVSKYSSVTIIALSVLLIPLVALAPATGGSSLYFAAPPVAAAVGVDVTLIIGLVALCLLIGMPALIALLKGYRKIHFKAKIPGFEAELDLQA